MDFYLLNNVITYFRTLIENIKLKFQKKKNNS